MAGDSFKVRCNIALSRFIIAYSFDTSFTLCYDYFNFKLFNTIIMGNLKSQMNKSKAKMSRSISGHLYTQNSGLGGTENQKKQKCGKTRENSNQYKEVAMSESYLNNESLALLTRLSEAAKNSCMIDPALYGQYEVKRGLRDISGRGVLAGLTEIAEVHSYIISENEMIPCEGKLYYRGIDIEEITRGFFEIGRFGYEETCYLLLFGKLPNQEELSEFNNLLWKCREMRHDFVRDIIMKSPKQKHYEHHSKERSCAVQF